MCFSLMGDKLANEYPFPLLPIRPAGALVVLMGYDDPIPYVPSHPTRSYYSENLPKAKQGSLFVLSHHFGDS